MDIFRHFVILPTFLLFLYKESIQRQIKCHLQPGAQQSGMAAPRANIQDTVFHKYKINTDLKSYKFYESFLRNDGRIIFSEIENKHFPSRNLNPTLILLRWFLFRAWGLKIDSISMLNQVQLWTAKRYKFPVLPVWGSKSVLMGIKIRAYFGPCITYLIIKKKKKKNKKKKNEKSFM